MEKRDYMREMFAEVDLEMMQRLSREIDPRGIANVGKMFPGQGVPGV